MCNLWIFFRLLFQMLEFLLHIISAFHLLYEIIEGIYLFSYIYMRINGVHKSKKLDYLRRLVWFSAIALFYHSV